MFGNIKKCKEENCKNPVWSKGLCQNHSSRKPLKSTGKITDKKSYNVPKMNLFFLGIWNKRKHESEISGTYLGKEPLTVYFHHILPKKKYEIAALDEENIILLTWEEHDQVEMDENRYPEINKRREKLKIKYNL